MVLIIISLTMLLVITFFNVLLGATFTEYTANTGYAVPVGIDSITGAIAIIIALVAIAVVVGIQILGSGISEQSIKAIIIVVGYASIWGIFSTLSLNLIIAIEIFGTIIYLFLTILYVIGVMEKLARG